MSDRPILRKKVDISIEDKIATAAIVSDDFIKNLHSIYQSDYIQNSMAKWVCDKALEFFTYYEGAPKSNIKAMFDIDKDSMNPSEAQLLSAFLTKINKQYEDGVEGVNNDLLLDRTIDYFKTREIQITSESALKYLSVGRIDLAEEAIHKSRKVQKPLSKWYNPFEPQHLINVFDDRRQGILTMPGHLGEMLGPLRRGWLVGVLGPFKRGKSWMLQEFALQALTQRLKVAYLNFEMSEGDSDERLFRRITGLKDPNEEITIYPCFDCVKNQTDECAKPDRKNRILLLDDEGHVPEFTLTNPYRPCTACRNKRNREYLPATWFEAVTQSDWSYKNARKVVRSFEKMYGNDNLRVRIYPRFSASVSDIKHDLDVLESTEDFIPDVFIADHANIIRPEHSSDGIKAIDQIWKELSGLTEERHMLGITASQGRRDSIYKTQLDQTDIAEWIGILGHVNVLFGLNQTEEEKRFGVLRAALLAHRHKKFDEKENCMILQQLNTGQANLDTHRVRIF